MIAEALVGIWVRHLLIIIAALCQESLLSLGRANQQDSIGEPLTPAMFY